MLETARLRLRRLDAHDAGDYSVLIGDAEVMRFIGSARAASCDAARAELKRLNARFEVDGFGVLAVERLADRRFLGRAGLYV